MIRSNLGSRFFASGQAKMFLLGRYCIRATDGTRERKKSLGGYRIISLPIVLFARATSVQREAVKAKNSPLIERRQATLAVTVDSGHRSWICPTKVYSAVTLVQNELEEARLQLSEAFLRFWEQADLVEDLLREQKPINTAKDLLDSLQVTLDELRRQVDTLEQGRAAA